MIEDLKKFKFDLEHFHKVVVPEEIGKKVGEIALRLHQGVVAGSPGAENGHPVETGWARANWGVHVGRAGVPLDPKGERPAKGSPILPANAYFDAKQILAMQDISKMNFVWIYNNVPYIEALEDGHSKKAPTGMVVNALNNVQTFMDNL